MRLKISKSKNVTLYYVIKTVYVDGKQKTITVEKLGNEQEVLKYAAMGERFSNHPIAKSIIKANKVDVDNVEVQEFKEIAGKGLSYQYDGKIILVGNSTLVNDENKADNKADDVKEEENK